jgi:hypothetical protein
MGFLQVPCSEDRAYRDHLTALTLKDIETLDELRCGFCRTDDVESSCHGRDGSGAAYHILVVTGRRAPDWPEKIGSDSRPDALLKALSDTAKAAKSDAKVSLVHFEPGHTQIGQAQVQLQPRGSFPNSAYNKLRLPSRPSARVMSSSSTTRHQELPRYSVLSMAPTSWSSSAFRRVTCLARLSLSVAQSGCWCARMRRKTIGNPSIDDAWMGTQGYRY